MSPRPSILERHGRLMARRRWIVIPLFLVLLFGAVMLAGRIGDVRLPPSFRDEGLRAALEARRRVPGTAVLVSRSTSSRPTPSSCWPTAPAASDTC